MSNETKTVPVELKTCPFCGSNNPHLRDRRHCWVIYCPECYAELDEDTEQKVVAKWNTRAAPAPDDELARLESVNNRLCVVSQQLYDANNTIKAIRELPDKWRKYSLQAQMLNSVIQILNVAIDNPEATSYIDSADCADELEEALGEAK